MISRDAEASERRTIGPIAPAAAGADDDGTRAIAEEAGGAGIVEVEHAAHPLRADHQHLFGTARLDRSRGEVER